MKLSVVIPCYNEEDNVIPLFECIITILNTSTFKYELIFINDGSTDNTFVLLNELYTKFPYLISVINFSRNFGKEAAIYAGLKHAKGDYVTIIDADLQQHPKLILDMVIFLEDNTRYDVIAAYQEHRIEGRIVSNAKNLFYKLINKVCDINFYPGASDFRTFRKNVIEAIISLPEYFRFSKGIFSWVGFETYYMPYIVHERHSGKSKWSLKGLIKYAIEGFISFTTFPLKLGTYLGILVSLLSVTYMIIVIIQKLFFSINIPGYPTLIVLILFLGGIQLLILGIIGEYLARVYIQSKNRPIYIEKQYLEIQENNNN